MKLLVIFCMIVGSYTGSYIPVLWGADYFSIVSILIGAVGGFAGIYIGYKLAQSWGLE
jgi:hypothetical protein